MRQVLDLHIHSPYARACSPSISLESIAKTCLVKGVDIVGSGDFTHPLWFKEIKESLSEIFLGSGLYSLKSDKQGSVKFIITSEVSLIYKDGGKTRKIHLLIHAPNLQAAERLNKYLDKKYNIRSDGRPILGIKAPDFVALVLKIHPDFLIYPAHIWTPWFSVFGSKSGFDSLEECFKEQTKNIYAFETGLSSDPEMNARLSSLDSLTLLSSSDAHSLDNIAREATVMSLSAKPSYNEIYDIVKYNKKGEGGGVLYTIEYYPQLGMYHADGHRNCNFSCLASKSNKLKNICPVCQKPLTIGVLNRVESLANRSTKEAKQKSLDFKNSISLVKIIAEALEIKTLKSKKVISLYNDLVSRYGSELYILLDLDTDLIKSDLAGRVKKGIDNMRLGKIELEAGYDGKYGELSIFNKN